MPYADIEGQRNDHRAEAEHWDCESEPAFRSSPMLARDLIPDQAKVVTGQQMPAASHHQQQKGRLEWHDLDFVYRGPILQERRDFKYAPKSRQIAGTQQNHQLSGAIEERRQTLNALLLQPQLRTGN